MWNYFVSHYIELQFGIAFPFTEVAFLLGILLILSPKTKRKSDIVWRGVELIIMWVLLTVGSALIEMYFDWIVKMYALVPGLIALYAIIRSKLPWDLRFVYGVLYYAVFLSSLTISSHLGRLMGDLLTKTPMVTATIQCLMLVGISAYIRFCRVEKYSTVPKYCSGLIILISSIHIFAHEILTGNGAVQTWVEIGFILIELVAFHLYYSISKMYDEKVRLNVLYLKQERENYVMELARSEIEKIKELRHDMKNHYTFMSYLVEEGRTEELKEYFEQYSTELYDALQFSLCGNYAIDYILNFEIRRARARSVEIDYKILVPPQLPFEDKDLCSLLTNILDNAIEAAAKMEDKTVELKLEWTNDVFLIHCSNATDRFTEGKISSHLPTTKDNRVAHGYGMKIIRSVVKKYNGVVKINVKDGKFHLSLFLGQPDIESVVREDKDKEEVSV